MCLDLERASINEMRAELLAARSNPAVTDADFWRFATAVLEECLWRGECAGRSEAEEREAPGTLH